MCGLGGPGLWTGGTLLWSRNPTTPGMARAIVASMLTMRALALVLITRDRYNSPAIRNYKINKNMKLNKEIV